VAYAPEQQEYLEEMLPQAYAQDYDEDLMAQGYAYADFDEVDALEGSEDDQEVDELDDSEDGNEERRQAEEAARAQEAAEEAARSELRRQQSWEFKRALSTGRKTRCRPQTARAKEEAAAQAEEHHAAMRQEEEDWQAMLAEARAALNTEPKAGPGVIKIMFCLPDGTRLMRRFRVDDTVQMFYDYVLVSDCDCVGRAPFNLVTAYPRMLLDKVYQTAGAAGLESQTQLMVVLKDDGLHEGEDDY